MYQKNPVFKYLVDQISASWPAIFTEIVLFLCLQAKFELLVQDFHAALCV